MLKRGRRGWHCNAYLDASKNPSGERFPSGGRDSTKSPQSMAYIRQIKTGDLVFLYQVDDESIHAISQADSCGMEADKGSRKYNLFYLKPAATAFRLQSPLTLSELRATGCDPKCFGPGTTGRIFPLTTEEFVGIIKAMARVNPDQNEDLSAWVKERSARA
jgi:hypothetical protein